MGFASLLIEDAIEIPGFKIFQGTNGLFVKEPQQPGVGKNEGNWYPIIKYVGEEDVVEACRKEIQNAILDEFQKRSNRQSNTSQQSNHTVANNYSETDDTPKKEKRTAPLW